MLATLLRAISRSLDSVESSPSSKNCVRTEGFAVPCVYEFGSEQILGRNGIDGEKEHRLTTRCFTTSRGPLRRKPFNLATSFIILWELVQGTHSGIFASQGAMLIQLPFGFSIRVILKLNIRVAVATKGSSSDSMSYPYITDKGIEMDSLPKIKNQSHPKGNITAWQTYIAV